MAENSITPEDIIEQGLRDLAASDKYRRPETGRHEPETPFSVVHQEPEQTAHLNPLDIQQLPKVVQRVIAIIKGRFPQTADHLEDTADLLRKRANQLDAMAKELRTAEDVVSESLHYWVSFEQRSTEAAKFLMSIASQEVHDTFDREEDRTHVH